MGNESDAKELDKLVEKGIFYILNVTKNIPFYNQNISENSKLFNLKRISVNDCPNEDLVQYFDEAFNFIGMTLIKIKLRIINDLFNFLFR